jgi:rubrerythrin
MAAAAEVIPLRPEQQPRGAVSNPTYDIISIFEHKLQALAAYEKYLQDFRADDENRRLVEQIRTDDERHVHMLRDCIERLCKEGKFR